VKLIKLIFFRFEVYLKRFKIYFRFQNKILFIILYAVYFNMHVSFNIYFLIYILYMYSDYFVLHDITYITRITHISYKQN